MGCSNCNSNLKLNVFISILHVIHYHISKQNSNKQEYDNYLTVMQGSGFEGQLPPQPKPCPHYVYCKQLYQGRSLVFKIRKNLFSVGATPSPYPISLGPFCALILAPLALATRRLCRLDFGGRALPPIFSSRTAPAFMTAVPLHTYMTT